MLQRHAVHGACVFCQVTNTNNAPYDKLSIKVTSLKAGPGAGSQAQHGPADADMYLQRQKSYPLKRKGLGEFIGIHPQEGAVRKLNNLECLGSINRDIL